MTTRAIKLVNDFTLKQARLSLQRSARILRWIDEDPLSEQCITVAAALAEATYAIELLNRWRETIPELTENNDA